MIEIANITIASSKDMGGFLGALAAIISLVVTVLWLVIAWRAMRAHENISYTLARQVAAEEHQKFEDMRSEKFTKTRLYKQFLREDPAREKLPAKERHQAFRDWSEAEEE